MTRRPGDGARIADLFRSARGILEVRGCDLDALAETDDIEICDFECDDPGCTAALLRGVDLDSGIMLAPGQIRGRRRFSIAHELGHFHMPRHAATSYFKCTDADLQARSTDARQLEWEANEFAAELLMPRRLFAADMARRDVSFTAIRELAATGMYDVSVTAAAWRFVQVTRERCALVVAHKGRVEWVARSSSFDLPRVERQQQLSPASIAGAMYRGEEAVGDCRPVPWHAWFDDAPSERVELLESAHAIPSLDQLLSLLWVLEDSDSDED